MEFAKVEPRLSSGMPGLEIRVREPQTHRRAGPGLTEISKECLEKEKERPED